MKTVKIFPQCKYKPDMPMCLRYDGYMVPCCFFGDVGDHWEELNRFLGDTISQLDITKYTPDEINRSEAFYAIEQSWSTNPMNTCKKFCSDSKNISFDIQCSGNRVIGNVEYDS